MNNIMKITFSVFFVLTTIAVYGKIIPVSGELDIKNNMGRDVTVMSRSKNDVLNSGSAIRIKKGATEKVKVKADYDQDRHCLSKNEFYYSIVNNGKPVGFLVILLEDNQILYYVYSPPYIKNFYKQSVKQTDNNLALSSASVVLNYKITPVIAAYFNTGMFKSAYTGHFVQTVQRTPFNKLTRLYIAFADIKDGRLSYYKSDINKIPRLKKTCSLNNPNAEIFITTDPKTPAEEYLKIAKDPKPFAYSVLNFLKDNGYDGLDIDWEKGIELNSLISLLKTLHETLSPEGYKLTFVAKPSPDFYKDKLPEISTYVDQINLLSYGSSFSLKDCVEKYINKGFPENRIIAGMSAEKEFRPGVDTLGENGSIKRKCDYVRANNLAGTMEWCINNDYSEGPHNMATFKEASAIYRYLSGSN